MPTSPVRAVYGLPAPAHSIGPRAGSSTAGSGCRRFEAQACFLKNCRPKKKGAPTCAGAPRRSGIAGYVPKPKLWTRSRETEPREESVVVGALAVIGDVEALALLFDRRAQPNDDVDDLVEDRGDDARLQ